MKFLITGIDGFLGGVIYRQALEGEWDCLGVSRRKQRIAPGIACIDLVDSNALLDLLNHYNPDCIINTAVRANFDSNCLAELYPVNVLAPAIMAHWCVENKAHLVQASGTIVHGLQNTNISINTPLVPDLDYGISKLLADQLIQASGCSHSIVRIGGIFGYEGPEHLGLNRSIMAALQGVAPDINGAGDAKRNYIYVEDVARAMLKCAADSDLMRGVFYAGGEIQTISSMLKSVNKVFLNDGLLREIEGGKASDQLIESSQALGAPSKFVEALQDIKERYVSFC